MKKIIKIHEEELNIKEIIKEVIETNWSEDKDRGKIISLLKGLAFSDDPIAKKFISDLDKLTTGMDINKYK